MTHKKWEDDITTQQSLQDVLQYQNTCSTLPSKLKLQNPYLLPYEINSICVRIESFYSNFFFKTSSIYHQRNRMIWYKFYFIWNKPIHLFHQMFCLVSFQPFPLMFEDILKKFIIEYCQCNFSWNYVKNLWNWFAFSLFLTIYWLTSLFGSTL